MEQTEPKRKFLLFNSLKIIVREYFIGTALYLHSLFMLSINNEVAMSSAIQWMFLIGIIYEQFIIRDFRYNSTLTKKEGIARLIVRVVFVTINIAAFGINIFA